MLAFEQKHRRTLVWLVVIGSHTAVFFWMGRSGGPDSRSREEIVSVALTLVPEWIEPSPPAKSPKPAPQTPSAILRVHEAVAPAELPVMPPASITPLPDWHAAAERAAQQAMAGDPDKPRDFASTPGSPYRDCQRKENNFEWKPDAKRTGFANGLPYVRVGKRCVVGLGFFGCAMDSELPPPDGALFEDMNTPNQMEGTVPGAQDCVAVTPVRP